VIGENWNIRLKINKKLEKVAFLLFKILKKNSSLNK